MGQIKRCAITGANGYVGSRIVNHFSQHGWAVCELRHRQGRLLSHSGSQVSYSLELGLDPEILIDYDVLIHCAYDFRPVRWDEILDVNVRGSERLFEAARIAGMRKIILISTMGAFAGCMSLYGRAKLQIEEKASRMSACIIRPGLVFGKNAGGMVGALNRMVSSWRVMPLVGEENQMLHLAHEADLCALVRRCAERKDGVLKPILAASEKGKTFREMLEVLSAAHKKRLVFVRMPWRFVWVALKCSEVLGLRFGFRSDSLISFVNKVPNPDFALIREMGVEFREFNLQTLVS